MPAEDVAVGYLAADRLFSSWSVPISARSIGSVVVLVFLGARGIEVSGIEGRAKGESRRLIHSSIVALMAGIARGRVHVPPIFAPYAILVLLPLCCYGKIPRIIPHSRKVVAQDVVSLSNLSSQVSRAPIIPVRNMIELTMRDLAASSLSISSFAFSGWNCNASFLKAFRTSFSVAVKRIFRAL